MNGRGSRGDGLRVQLPLLDRLLDDRPDLSNDPTLTAGEALAVLRRSVRRDLEALLNARRPWRSWPARLGELKASAVGYGIPDFTAGALNDPGRREQLRAEIEATIRRFEPRFAALRVIAAEQPRDEREPRLRLRIEALLRTEPAPEPVAFDTLVDATSAAVSVREQDGPASWGDEHV
jgi:type VI secretion system protein ImpF